MSRGQAIAVLLSGLISLAPLAARGAQTAAQCQAAQIKAAAVKASKKLACQATAIKKDATVDADCLSNAEAKFADTFAKIEAKGGCPRPTDNTSTVEQDVDTFMQNVVKHTASCIASHFLCFGNDSCCSGVCQQFSGGVSYCQ